MEVVIKTLPHLGGTVKLELEMYLLQKNIGAGRPKLKPLENTLCKRGSVKEEAQERYLSNYLDTWAVHDWLYLLDGRAT